MLRFPLDARHVAARFFIAAVVTVVVASVDVKPPAAPPAPPVVEVPSTVIASTRLESREFDVMGVRVERWRDVVRRPSGEEFEVERAVFVRAGEVVFADVAPAVTRLCDQGPTRHCGVRIETISNYAVDLRIDSHMEEASVERGSVKIDLRSGRPFTLLEAIRPDRRQEVVDLCRSQVTDEQLCSPVGLDEAELKFSRKGEWVLNWVAQRDPSRGASTELRVPFAKAQDLLDPAGPLRLAEVDIRRTPRLLAVADNGLRIVAVELGFVLDGVAVDRGRFELPEVQTASGTPVWSSRIGSNDDGWGWRHCFTMSEEWSRRRLALNGRLITPGDVERPVCGFEVNLLHGPFVELIHRWSGPMVDVLRLNLDTGRRWSVRNAIRPERWTDYMNLCRRRVFKHMFYRDFNDNFDSMSHVCGFHDDVPVNVGTAGLTFQVFVLSKSDRTETVRIAAGDLQDLLEPDGPWGSMVPPPSAPRRVQRSLPLQ